MWKIKCILGVSLIAVCFQLYFHTVSASSHEFDYYVFSQQWPPSLCIHAEQERISCSIPNKVKSWVIHGLWPSNSKPGSESPFFCNSSWHFNESEIKSIEDQLEIHWPNIFTHSKRLSFWKHEWEKHGTCAEDKPYIFSEKSYFEMGIKLNKKYDIKSMYDNSGILAVNYTSYKCEDFRNVIRKNWQVESIITCIPGPDDKQYILQTEICLDKHFKPINCTSDQLCQQCSKNKDIWYPSIGNSAIPVSSLLGGEKHTNPLWEFVSTRMIVVMLAMVLAVEGSVESL